VRATLAAIFSVTLALHAPPAEAIMSGAESPRARSSDSDYADGREAFLRKDWKAAIESLLKVVERRPHHDNAHNMLGFSYRKLGDYERAFYHYEKALELNPRHKQALEYMGEGYLELGRIEEAKATAIRLDQVCRFVVMAFDNNGWKYGCEELEHLKKAFAEHGVPWPLPE
jgi:tetratricopeptide (TPR) repeat protein